MTPKGVEQPTRAEPLLLVGLVTSTMTPKGVEQHHTQGLLPQSQPVTSTMTPKGVEQASKKAATTAISGDLDDDAERR